MAYDHQRILSLLTDSLKAEATDILLKVPGRPMFRSADRLIPTPYPELTPADTQRAAQELLGLAMREAPLARIRELEFSFGVNRLGRFRVHLYRQRGSIAIVIHRMALSPPSLQDLQAPELVSRLAWSQPGIVLVTGRRARLGLLAALTDAYNRGYPGHLVSIEDPMEYLHQDIRAAISQREVSVDTDSYRSGLLAARRENPDGVVIHDLPDAETAELALRMAESGCRVIASISGCQMTEVTRWFTRMFPEYRESEMATRLSEVLTAVISETDGKIKILPTSEAIRGAILRHMPLPLTRAA
ncbi:MAG: ATPase, T2SS/T4P/T4SS family [Myxococcota bacterium]|nr:ATPase, T2SS/T4P/T4SS family [Myxococcota bacterium]